MYQAIIEPRDVQTRSVPITVCVLVQYRTFRIANTTTQSLSTYKNQLFTLMSIILDLGFIHILAMTDHSFSEN